MVDSSGVREALALVTDASVQHSKWLAERDRRIVVARVAGATWEALADAAKMSRQGVINVFNRETAEG